MYSRKTILLLTACLLSISLYAQPAQRFDLIIHEIFADPTPVIGLPNSEYIEVRNRSGTPLNLLNWRISDGTSTGRISTAYLLQPDSLVILCGSAAQAEFAHWGPALAVSGFPSLNNEGEIISLISPEGNLIHAVSYEKSWYKNDVKQEGGWSLEMIDARYPCTGIDNWTASQSPDGGTPGRKNSVESEQPDLRSPLPLRSHAPDSLQVLIEFDESLDSLSASQPGHYQLLPGNIPPISATPLPPLFREVLLQFPAPLAKGAVYQVQVTGVSDCAGNSLILPVQLKTGQAADCREGDLIFNEILFNPPTGGSDYVELFNRSNRVIDLGGLLLANRGNTGNLTALTAISDRPLLVFPGEFLALSTDRAWVLTSYSTPAPEQVMELKSLPSLPDDQGRIVLLTRAGLIVDELAYDRHWHFALLQNEEGVALERIRPEEKTQLAGNWTSASSAAGFGTPAAPNSQSYSGGTASSGIRIEPAVFSPDGDGWNDFTWVHYYFDEPGYVGSFTIYDLSGRRVRQLLKNATLSREGTVRWDGLDDRQQPLASGPYILLAELFNLRGQTSRFKFSITIARKF